MPSESDHGACSESPPCDISESRPVYERLDMYHHGKIGFVIYRTDYSNDSRWARFMDRLTQYAEYELDNDDDNIGMNYGAKLKAVFAWDVRDDKAAFEGASIEDIRRNFSDWADAFPRGQFETKYSSCILADEEVVDSVVDGELPGSGFPYRAYVKVVHRWHERQEDLLGSRAYGHAEVTGCTAYYVGWQKRYARLLFPRGYSLLKNQNFYIGYKRPPAVCED